VFGHNLEVVPRLYPEMRSRAGYARSLQLLRKAKELDASSYNQVRLMVGVGETEDEVVAVMSDLRGVGCDFVTVGSTCSRRRDTMQSWSTSSRQPLSTMPKWLPRLSSVRCNVVPSCAARMVPMRCWKRQEEDRHSEFVILRRVLRPASRLRRVGTVFLRSLAPFLQRSLINFS